MGKKNLAEIEIDKDENRIRFRSKVHLIKLPNVDFNKIINELFFFNVKVGQPDFKSCKYIYLKSYNQLNLILYY